MANTDISLTTQNGAVSCDTQTVTVFAGDTFTVTSSGDEVSLFFSSDLLNVLSPAPSSPITLASGQGTSFTFTSSDPGGYFLTCAATGVEVDPTFPSEISNALHVQAVSIAIMPPPPPPVRPVVVKGTGPTINPQGAD